MNRLGLALLLLSLPAIAQRLPHTVVPSHYRLALDPNIASRTFSGDESIDVDVKAQVQEIVMNSLDLEISHAEVQVAGKTQPATVEYNKADEMIRLQLAAPLPPGRAQVHITYNGKLTEGLRGLYLSKSSRREYLVTQFEGTYARMMFPCFDEPAFKATFDLSVTADKGDTAISNGKILKDVPSRANRHQITFATSPRMSTYLVALAVGDWSCSERTQDGVPIRVCAVPEKKDYTGFGLDVAAHSIAFYDQWYGIKYPFGKLDMVAIPDYEWGGMENTAAIFYRDSALLLDTQNASVFRERRQAQTIAHEIAHQWFGDLVTAAWWDDIWLNEGFATWMSSKPIEAWHPEWNFEDEDAAQAQRIISVDSLASARAIHGNPVTPSQIKEMFDGITYEKGAAVLRMLESFLGPEVFRKGVNLYLAAHANGNATSADFWQAEAQASGKPVDRIMPTFVLQPGVPMLSLRAHTCSSGTEQLDLAQQRFLISGQPTASAATELWQIPVCAHSSSGSNASCSVIAEEQQTAAAGECSKWTFLNRGAKGYYRVAYSPEDLHVIAEVAEAQLSAPERIALVEDTWAMTRAGKNSLTDFLAVSKSLRPEQNRTVVDSLSGHLEYVGEYLATGDAHQQYEAFLRAQFAPLAQQVGWTSRANDSDEQKAIRATLLEILGGAGDQSAIAAARQLVSDYERNPEAADATLVDGAFQAVAQNGDAETYKEFSSRLRSSKSSDEYYHYLYALTDFRQQESVKNTLGLVQEGVIRRQDFPRFFAALLENDASREVTWDYLKSHWNELATQVTSFGGNGAVSALGSACSEPMRDDIQQFFRDHPAPGAERAVQQSLERIRSCIEFRQRQSGTDWQTALGSGE